MNNEYDVAEVLNRMKEISSFSVVVPCYNEEKNIPLMIDRFKAAINKFNQEIETEIIIVNNGSTDSSEEVLNKKLQEINDPRFKVVKIENNQGYGGGIVTGLRSAKGEVMAWTHADLQTDPHDVFQAFNTFERYFIKHGGSTPLVKGHRVKRRLSEWLFTLGMSLMSTLVLGRRLFDINGQPKVFSRELFLFFKDPPKDLSLDLYLFYLARKHKISVKQIDVIFSERVFGESKWAFDLKTKIKTILKTIAYIFELRSRVQQQA